ncbi:MAG TPA: alkaline phosphatase family protein [Chthoniobacterales bacterium]
MQSRFLLAVALLLPMIGPVIAQPRRGKANHVVVVVWDGMRPDFISPENTPTLAGLARSGVFFRNNHPVFPSSTNVNGAALATGNYPGDNGVFANEEFRPAIDPHSPIDTSDFPALDASDGRINRDFLHGLTIAELVQQTGRRTAVAGSKPVAQFFDRARRRETAAARASIVLYRGKVLPASASGAIFSALGPFPKRKGLPNEEEDAWTTRGLTDFLWKDDVPEFSLLWLSEPDLSQHQTGPGSPTARAAIKSDDDKLARVIAALQAKKL